MSHPSPTQGHGHDDGAVHAHISSSIFYMAVFAALIILTVTTVAQSYVDLGKLNLVVVIAIASMKASLVVAFFMHLRWDNKFNVLIFVSCIFFIGVFFAYTLNDTDHRGELDPAQNTKILPATGQEAPGGLETHTEAAGEHGPANGPSGAESPTHH